MPGQGACLAGLPGERSRSQLLVEVMTRKPCRSQAPAAEGLRAGAALAYFGRWALCAAALCRPAVVPGAPDRGARRARRAGRTDAGHGPALQPPPAAALLSGWWQAAVSLDCLQCMSSQPMVHPVLSLHIKSQSLTSLRLSAIGYIWQVGADELINSRAGLAGLRTGCRRLSDQGHCAPPGAHAQGNPDALQGPSGGPGCR